MFTGNCCLTQHSVEFYVIFDYRYSPWFVDNTSSLNDTSAENVRIGDASLGWRIRRYILQTLHTLHIV